MALVRMNKSILLTPPKAAEVGKKFEAKPATSAAPVAPQAAGKSETIQRAIIDVAVEHAAALIPTPYGKDDAWYFSQRLSIDDEPVECYGGPTYGEATFLVSLRRELLATYYLVGDVGSQGFADLTERLKADVGTTIPAIRLSKALRALGYIIS